MQFRVVTLRFDPVLEAFDDTPLQELLKGGEVFTVRDRFTRNFSPQYPALPAFAAGHRSGCSRGWVVGQLLLHGCLVSTTASPLCPNPQHCP